jgi:hypothetical protein
MVFVEPKHSQLVKDYMINGDNVVIIGGVLTTL